MQASQRPTQRQWVEAWVGKGMRGKGSGSPKRFCIYRTRHWCPGELYVQPQGQEGPGGEAMRQLLLARLGRMGGLTAALPLPSQCPL